MKGSCRSCGSTDLEVMLDLGPMPLAGGFLDSPEVFGAEQLYPLAVHVCGKCALVQIVEPVSQAVLFDNYSFSASTVPALVAHFNDYAQWIYGRFKPSVVVEFGCNDGVLLKPLIDLGVVAVGVDLSPNIGDIARARGLDVVTAGFTPEIAGRLRQRVGSADVVTGSNAFAHNADPETILAAADVVLKPDGRLCLEVMYAADLLEQLQWDTLYHEHLTFYGVTQLHELLRRNGFVLEHAERVPMHGGSLRVVAARSGVTAPGASVDELEAYEQSLGLTDASTWHGFAARCQRTIDVASSVLHDLHKHHEIWGYGAAGKATMWLNACHLDFLEGMVDASPLRAGKFMPGTHTPIYFPEEFRKMGRPGIVLVTAWNYLEAIRRNEAWYGGLWVTPLPSLSFC